MLFRKGDERYLVEYIHCSWEQVDSCTIEFEDIKDFYNFYIYDLVTNRRAVVNKDFIFANKEKLIGVSALGHIFSCDIELYRCLSQLTFKSVETGDRAYQTNYPTLYNRSMRTDLENGIYDSYKAFGTKSKHSTKCYCWTIIDLLCFCLEFPNDNDNLFYIEDNTLILGFKYLGIVTAYTFFIEDKGVFVKSLFSYRSSHSLLRDAKGNFEIGGMIRNIDITNEYI